jgi:hypothetical protein
MQLVSLRETSTFVHHSSFKSLSSMHREPGSNTTPTPQSENKDRTSVPDPDPPDPLVFGPPGSGSFNHQAKIVRKTLILTVL